MPQISLRNLLVTVLLGIWCIPAHAQTFYRLARIIADPPSAASLIAWDLNDRGQVVGRGGSDGAPNAFAWRDGVATNLQPLIDPDSVFTDATGTNNHSDAVGNFVDSQSGLFTGFLLRRGERVIRIEGLPSAASTFVSDINNRRQVIGVSYDATDHMYAFLWERGNITPLPPLQGDTSAVPNRINDRDVVVGVSGERAVIWRNGRVRDLGLPGSRG